MNKYTKLLNFLVFLLIFNNASSQITYEFAFPNINFEYPVELQSPFDGTNRMFVLEQPGLIKVFPIDPNITSNDVTIFLDLNQQMVIFMFTILHLVLCPELQCEWCYHGFL